MQFKTAGKSNTMKPNANRILPIVAVIAVVSLSGLQTSEGNPPFENVTVNNTPANPVPVMVQNPTTAVTIQNTPSVKAADNPAFQPYVQSGSHFDQIGSSDSISFDVPAGKRLVIELVTVTLDLPTGQNQATNSLLLNEGSPRQVIHEMTSTAEGDNGGGSRFVTTQTLRAYAEAGTGTVKIHIGRNSSASTFGWSVSVSGYLVDLP